MESIELEPSSGLIPVADTRPRMDEPLPVRLVAVDDVRLTAPPGRRAELDRFYVELWEFARDLGTAHLVYRAENFRLRFIEIAEQKPAERGSLRPQGIEVKSLREAELKLVDAEIEYLRQRGLIPGQYSLLVQDPAGNWIELFDALPVG